MHHRSGWLCKARRIVLAACLGLALGAAPASAGVGAAEPEADVREKEPGNVADRTHDFLERSFYRQVVWFDDFFGRVETEDLRPPDYRVRWQNAFRVAGNGRSTFRTSVRANLRLPRISERLHLVFSGENEQETAPGLPEDAGNPGFDRTLRRNARLVNTELRYNFLRDPGLTFFLGAGVRLRIPPEAFVRARFLYEHRLGNLALLRFGETPFWKDRDGIGETTEVSLERQIGPKMLLLWGNSGTISQRSRGLEWGSELSLLRQLAPDRAVTLAGGAFGTTRPSAVVETWRVYARYRSTILREWLFYELEPEVFWPRSATGEADGGYRAALAGTLRLEVAFRGAAAAEAAR